MVKGQKEFIYLVALRDEVYGGCWRRMQEELEIKLSVWRPERLRKKIKLDLERVKKIIGDK